MTTFDRIKDILARSYDAQGDITRTTELSDIGEGWDSLEFDGLAIELFMDIEEAFDIEIPDDDIFDLHTVGDATDLVDRLMAKGDA